jgi:hypothetical protein
MCVAESECRTFVAAEDGDAVNYRPLGLGACLGSSALAHRSFFFGS